MCAAHESALSRCVQTSSQASAAAVKRPLPRDWLLGIAHPSSRAGAGGGGGEPLRGKRPPAHGGKKAGGHEARGTLSPPRVPRVLRGLQGATPWESSVWVTTLSYRQGCLWKGPYPGAGCRTAHREGSLQSWGASGALSSTRTSSLLPGSALEPSGPSWQVCRRSSHRELARPRERSISEALLVHSAFQHKEVVEVTERGLRNFPVDC